MSTRKLAEVVREVAVKAVPELQKPPMYRVLLINDDYTPMDFVVEVLRHYFLMSEPIATMVMMQVHRSGKGECGVYTRDIAETKVTLVNNCSRANQQPLLCIMERT